MSDSNLVLDSAGWSRVVTGDGSITLAHPLHGQTCHSRAGAWTEARERYALACRVRERALELQRAGRATFHLLDVGTGLGLNIAAALESLDGTGVALDVVTLESERSVIEATLTLGSTAIPELERHHGVVRRSLARALATIDARESHDGSARAQAGEGGELATEACVELGQGHVRLHLGDGRATIHRIERNPVFDAVFLDAFSPGVDASLWEPDFISEIAARMAPASLLSTYTVSIGVRAALLNAGLSVGLGERVGTKASGTLAGKGSAIEALDSRTQRRIEARASVLRHEIRP
ncbi:MAG: MnmC family methyltransferase [Planctomycetota bacterium]|nr:MnmC family methyltransferase [Planctomycetota bacterium]